LETPLTDLATTTPTAPAPTPSTAAVDAERAHLNMLVTLAKLTTDTEMVPKALRGRPSAALAVMVYGHELGLRPMTALREVFIIDGTPSCSAKLMRALIFRAGHKLVWKTTSSTECVLYGVRADGQGEATVTWTMDDARAAGVQAKDVWKKYPRAMLAARATSELARLIFPDVTVGYTPEELGRVDLSGQYDYLDVEEADAPPDDTGGGRVADDPSAAELIEAVEAGIDPTTGEIIHDEPCDTPGAS
jgi:hypothetical protein